MLSLDHKYLQRLVETSPDIVIAVDVSGVIVYYNDGARRSLRYNPEEIIGQSCLVLYKSGDEARRVMAAMRTSSDHGRISSFESAFYSKSGEQIPVAISGSLIYDESGAEVGSIGFARDIREMRRRERLATAGEIAVSLAHEINNPLEAITNNLELITRACESHFSGAEMVVEAERLDSIRSGLDRVQAIVKRLDEMARSGIYESRDYLQGRRMTDLAPREPSANSNGNTASREWPLTGMSILVVDDDPSVLNSLSDLLRAERCAVQSALRPSHALALLRNMRFDAVISDVVMPEMDGYEFYLKVKSELPALPVILMTAYYYDKDHIIKRSRLEGLEAAIFKKPVNPAKLRDLLLAVRRKAPPPRPASEIKPAAASR